GLETVICRICTETLSTTVIPATGHTEGTPEIIDATCTTEGSRKKLPKVTRQLMKVLLEM
ncbi:MAG: hypothetical protein II217_06405, partial [Alistipes sp.]|nr:hypothetical protein [Alistipes sp.]